MPKTFRKSLGLSPDYSTQTRQNFGIDIDRLCCSARNKNPPVSSPFNGINITTGEISTSLDQLNRAGILFYKGQISDHHPLIKNKKIYQFTIDPDYMQRKEKAPIEHGDKTDYILKVEEKPDKKALEKLRKIGKFAYKNEEAFLPEKQDGLLHTTRRALCVQILAESLGVGHAFAHADLAKTSDGEFGLLMQVIKGITIEECLNQHNLIIQAAEKKKETKLIN